MPCKPQASILNLQAILCAWALAPHGHVSRRKGESYRAPGHRSSLKGGGIRVMFHNWEVSIFKVLEKATGVYALFIFFFLLFLTSEIFT